MSQSISQSMNHMNQVNQVNQVNSLPNLSSAPATSAVEAAKNSVLSLLREFPHFLSFHGKTFAEPVQGFAFEGLDGGLPKGALIEISGTHGSGKTEIALRFLAQNPDLRVAWVEEEFSVYPSAFPQNHVGLERVLFVDSPPGDLLWTVHQMLRSSVFGVIVLRMATADKDEMTLRRLQLLAEKSGVSVVLLTDRPAQRGTWPIAVQLHSSRAIDRSAILLNVLKYRGQKSWQLAIT